MVELCTVRGGVKARERGLERTDVDNEQNSPKALCWVARPALSQLYGDTQVVLKSHTAHSGLFLVFRWLPCMLSQACVKTSSKLRPLSAAELALDRITKDIP